LSSDDDLPGCLGEGLARDAAGNGAVLVDVAALQGLLGRMLLCLVARAQLAPHLPAHPEKEDAACKQESYDLEELGCQKSEDDAQDRGGQNAEQDRLVALLLRETGSGKADDDGIVAGERQIDADHHQEGDDLRSEKLREIKHAVPHMSGCGQRMRNVQRDASGIVLPWKCSRQEPKCRQNRLFERTQAVLVFIQSDIAAPVGSDQRGPAWLRGPSRQPRSRDQVTSHGRQRLILRMIGGFPSIP
jgi:hypothetical protein